MNVVLWIVQGLLAAAFLMAGVMKVTQPIDALGKQMGWVRDVPLGLVRFIGVAEALGAVGLILPLLTGVLPWLTVAAAIALAVVMVFAAVFHLYRAEASRMPASVVLFLLALLVVVGRLAIVPVS